MSLNVFTGKDALKKYLKPDPLVFSPLVEIPEELNPFYKNGIRIYTKLLSTLPLTNVKSIPAFQMLEDYFATNTPDSINHTIVESSSGNTVMSLGILGRHFGVKSTKAYVSHEVGIGKLNALRFFGIEPIVVEDPICPDPEDKNSSIYKTKEAAKKNNWLNPGQYDNPSNPKGHYLYTGPQIYSQLNGDIQIFCAGLGTTGTLTGTTEFLKEKNNKLFSLGVCRVPNNDVPGVRTIGQLSEISIPWKEQCDSYVSVDTINAFSDSLALCRMGLMVGPSSGFNFAGLKKFLSSKTEEDFNKLRNAEGIINAVFISCDLPFPYMEEYFEYLGEELFPKIENANLLKNTQKKIQPQEQSQVSFISSNELYKEYFIAETITNKNIILIDVREPYEFNDFHILSSINIPLNEVTNRLPLIERIGEKDKIIIICKSGYRSTIASVELKKIKLNTIVLEGGLMNWSEKNYPRCKNNNCGI